MIALPFTGMITWADVAMACAGILAGVPVNLVSTRIDRRVDEADQRRQTEEAVEQVASWLRDPTRRPFELSNSSSILLSDRQRSNLVELYQGSGPQELSAAALVAFSGEEQATIWSDLLALVEDALQPVLAADVALDAEEVQGVAIMAAVALDAGPLRRQSGWYRALRMATEDAAIRTTYELRGQRTREQALLAHLRELEAWVDEHQQSRLGVPIDPLGLDLQRMAVHIQRTLSLEGSLALQTIDATPRPIRSIVLERERVVLAGAPLAGKTHALLELARAAIADALAEIGPEGRGPGLVPFVVRARDLVAGQTLERTLAEGSGAAGLDVFDVRSILADPSITSAFFVDGLDEASDPDVLLDHLGRIGRLNGATIIATTQLTFTEPLPCGLEDGVFLLASPDRKDLAAIAEKVALQGGGVRTVVVDPDLDARFLDTIGSACMFGLWLREYGREGSAAPRPTSTAIVEDLLRARCIRDLRRHSLWQPIDLERFESEWSSIKQALGTAALHVVCLGPAMLADERDQPPSLELSEIGLRATAWLAVTRRGSVVFAHQVFAEHLAAARLAALEPVDLRATIEGCLLGVPGSRRTLALAVVGATDRDQLLRAVLGVDGPWPSPIDVVLERTSLGIDIAVESVPGDWSKVGRDALAACVVRGLANRSWALLMRLGPEWWTKPVVSYLIGVVADTHDVEGVTILRRVAPDRMVELARALLDEVDHGWNVAGASALALDLPLSGRQRRRLLSGLETSASVKDVHPNAAAAMVALIRDEWPPEVARVPLERIARHASQTAQRSAVGAIAALAQRSDNAYPMTLVLRRLARSRSTSRVVRYLSAAYLHRLDGSDMGSVFRRVAHGHHDEAAVRSLIELDHSGDPRARSRIERIGLHSSDERGRSVAAAFIAEVLGHLTTEGGASGEPGTAVRNGGPSREHAVSSLFDEQLSMHERARILQDLVAGGEVDTTEFRRLARSANLHGFLRNRLAELALNGNVAISKDAVQAMLLRSVRAKSVHIHIAIESIGLLSENWSRDIWVQTAVDRLTKESDESFFRRVALSNLAVIGGQHATLAIADSIMRHTEWWDLRTLEFLRWGLASSRRSCTTVEWLELVERSQAATMAVLSNLVWPDDAGMAPA